MRDFIDDHAGTIFLVILALALLGGWYLLAHAPAYVPPTHTSAGYG